MQKKYSGNAHPVKSQRTINIFVLSMLSVVLTVSLRNLPVAAHYGFSSFTFYLLGALLFMIPYSLVSAELASGWPKEGGLFVWVREALGDRWGFFAIWMQWFHNMTWYPAMLAFLASGIAYLFYEPNLANNKPFLLTIILVGMWSVTFLNLLGIKISAWVSALCAIVGTILPAAILIFMAILWLVMGRPIDLTFSPSSFIPDFRHLSNLAYLAGIFLALAGMELTANLAREVKNPQRNYPKAILIATIVSLVILAFGSMAIAVVIPTEQIGFFSGILEAFEFFFASFKLGWVMPVMAFAIILGAFGELNAGIVTLAKGLYVTSEHGFLPPFLHKTNKRHMPVNLLYVQAGVATLAAFIIQFLPNANFSFWIFSVVSAQMYILAYLFLFIAGLVLRYKKPHVKRSYRIPFGNTGIWVITVLGFSSALFVLFISFFPPPQIEVKQISHYLIPLLIGLGVNIVIPLLIYAFRRPHWKKEILHESREEIREQLH